VGDLEGQKGRMQILKQVTSTRIARWLAGDDSYVHYRIEHEAGDSAEGGLGSCSGAWGVNRVVEAESVRRGRSGQPWRR
jgi:hypothetical protein